MNKVRKLTQEEPEKGIYRVRVPLLRRSSFNMRRYLYYEAASAKEAEEKAVQEIGQKVKVLKYAKNWESAKRGRLEDLLREV